MVLSSLKQENVLQETQETVVNERTAGMLNPAKHATLKCTENELKQRMSRYCGQSYIWGMNNRVKCFQKFPKDVYSLYSLLICRDGSRYWTGFLSFDESGRSKHSTCEEKVSEFHFYISLKSISVYCFSLPRVFFFRCKNPFICRRLVTFNLF